MSAGYCLGNNGLAYNSEVTSGSQNVITNTESIVLCEAASPPICLMHPSRVKFPRHLGTSAIEERGEGTGFYLFFFLFFVYLCFSRQGFSIALELTL